MSNAVARLTPAASVVDQLAAIKQQARALSDAHVTEMMGALTEFQRVAAQVRDGGDLYHPGVRAIASRLINQVEAELKAIDQLQRTRVKL